MDDDPLSLSGTTATTSTAMDFEVELKQSQDPNTLLVRWCVEGRSRVSMELAEEGSLIRQSAHLLSSETHSIIPPPSNFTTPETTLLHVAFLFKNQRVEEAIKLVHGAIQKHDLPSIWKRRAYCALAWMLASTGDYSSVSFLSSSWVQDITLSVKDVVCLHLALSRVQCECGNIGRAREEFNCALAIKPRLLEDARWNLGEARCNFAEGKLNEAASLWHEQLAQKPTVLFRPQSAQEEPIESWFVGFAVAQVIGDLGEIVLTGSRQAIHEAANNFSVCCLHAGRLDGAVRALEDVLNMFNPHGQMSYVDNVVAGNLKTLYELCRTPRQNRLIY